MNIQHHLYNLNAIISHLGIDREFQKRISIGLTVREALQLPGSFWLSEERGILIQYLGFSCHMIPEPRQPIVDPSMA